MLVDSSLQELGELFFNRNTLFMDDVSRQSRFLRRQERQTTINGQLLIPLDSFDLVFYD